MLASCLRALLDVDCKMPRMTYQVTVQTVQAAGSYVLSLKCG